jgi:DNA-binding NarL/FixJ family response regulator
LRDRWSFRRNRRIVELILRGMMDKQIAQTLGLSVSTVRTHLGRIFTRLSVADRVELILHIFKEFRRLEECRRNRRHQK